MVSKTEYAAQIPAKRISIIDECQGVDFDRLEKSMFIILGWSGFPNIMSPSSEPVINHR